MKDINDSLFYQKKYGNKKIKGSNKKVIKLTDMPLKTESSTCEDCEFPCDERNPGDFIAGIKKANEETLRSIDVLISLEKDLRNKAKKLKVQRKSLLKKEINKAGADKKLAAKAENLQLHAIKASYDADVLEQLISRFRMEISLTRKIVEFSKNEDGFENLFKKKSNKMPLC